MSEASPIRDREEQLQRTADNDLPTLRLADDVSWLLAEVAQAIRVDAGAGDRTPRDMKVHALWFMAIVALRALRAGMQVLRSGYEDQAVGYQRLIDELHNRAQKVRSDPSGEYARQWLEGRGALGSGAKLAGQDFWEFLSGPVHANARGILDWLAVSQEDGSAKVVVGPERRPEVSNAALAYMSSEGRDIAVALALEYGKQLDVRSLDARIRAAHVQWMPENEE